MRPLRLFVLAALLLGAVVVGVAVVTAAALPLALVLGATVLTLVAGVGTRLRHRAGWRRDRVGRDAPDTRFDGAPERRWSTRWEADPPVHAVPDTREQVAATLAEWGLTGEPVEPTLLVVTELLSNAIDHARGPVALSVELSADAVRVEVRDAAPEAPQRQPPDPTRTRGRGVYLVEALSLRWGWTPDPPGKVVWAEVPTRWPA